MKQIGRRLAKNVDAYTDASWADVYAGSAAKAVVLAQTAGDGPADFGGVDLVDRLNEPGQQRQADRRPDRGQDDRPATSPTPSARRSPPRARRRAVEPRPTRRSSSCSSSSARRASSGSTSPTTSPRDQTCDGRDRRPTSAPDTDVTALAVLTCSRCDDRSRQGPARRSTTRVAWLERKQAHNGSFGGGTATEAANTNSTGLAAWALGEAGACRPAAKAAALGPQAAGPAGNVSGTELAGENGAIAYDKAAYREARGRTASTVDGARPVAPGDRPGRAPGLRLPRRRAACD